MPDLLKRNLVLVLENCDMDTEQLSELFADALDGALPVNENHPIVVSVEEPPCGNS